MFRKPPLRWYFMAWVPLVAVYVALYMASGRTLLQATRSAMVSVVPFALLGLMVLRVPQQLPWPEGRRASFFLAQFGLTMLYGLLGSALVMALWTLDVSMNGGPPVRIASLNTAWQAVIGGLMYLAIGGGAYAWESGQRVREEAARASQADALRSRAELAALRSQLNPHFLLNTLHAALGLVRRDPALAERALERLGEVLHYGLRMHRESLDKVLLADEWAFVRSYLEIEHLRLEERLRLRLEAPGEVMHALVPPFVLQPLVENAILHAVAPRKAGGTVSITAVRRDRRLRLEVCDDGPGMAEEARGGAGLGLRLLRERLTLLYSGDATLSVGPAGGGGVRALIELPFHSAAEVDAP